MFNNVEIETERLIIKPFRAEDAGQWQAVLSQEEVMQYLPEDVMTLKEVEDLIAWFQGCYEKNTPDNIIKWTLAVCFKRKRKDRQATPRPNEAGPEETIGEVIGWAGIGPWEPDPSEVELFYGISREYWGKGFATEAARAVMQYAFGTIGLKRLVAVADPVNAGSVRVLEKIGMKFEKTLENLPEKFRSDEGAVLYTCDSPVGP